MIDSNTEATVAKTIRPRLVSRTGLVGRVAEVAVADRCGEYEELLSARTGRIKALDAGKGVTVAMADPFERLSEGSNRCTICSTDWGDTSSTFRTGV